MSSFFSLITFSIIAAALMLSGQVRGEFIQPVSAFASNGEATQDALINGQGFDDPGIGTAASIHSTVAGEMWSGIGSIKEYVVFDLGKTVTLTNVYIWNYNAPDATDVGMKDVEVQVSADTNLTTANFNAIAKISLKEGGEAAQSFPVIGTSVRLVKLKGLSNWGQGYTVGLAEVRFESGSVTGNVPVILLNGPHDGDEIAFGRDIAIDAAVTDKEGASNIQKVEFFDGDILLTNRTVAPFSGVLKGASKGDHSIRVMATDKTGKMAWVTANVFVRELVADRILKIDDTADEGTDVNQISYTGTWTLAQGVDSDPRYMHNDHYESSNTKADYFEVRFKGVKIDVFATVASHHGTGLASIDGGPTSIVNYKAAQRGEQVFVWASPILPNREHVLRIRVVGDGVVTADRFDVSVSDKPEISGATVREVLTSFTNIVVTLEDAAGSVVDPTSVKLALDGTLVNATTTKAGSLTMSRYDLSTPFAPGSAHALKITAKDTAGISLTNETTFTLPAPIFPLSGLGLPPSTAGNWSVRELWNAGRADALVSAVAIATATSSTGNVNNSRSAVIDFVKSTNPGNGGLFFNDLPLPAESLGLTENDFVIAAHAKVRIPTAGDWTIGVHTDEGFALRFAGGSFGSVSGLGEIDENFPEFLLYKNNTANSNTRGVLTNLAAGDYVVDFISWQRVGPAAYEIYAVPGAFAEDADTDQWQLIGSTEGVQIVSEANLSVKAVTKQNASLVIEFTSPNLDGQHQVLESIDLKTWQLVAGATFQKQPDRIIATIGGVTAPRKFYKIQLP